MELRTNLLLAYPIAHLGYSPRACGGGTGTANTINLANSSFTDVDLDCTVSKESWCLLLVKNHLISQAKTFTGEQVFWGWRVWPSCLHGMSQSIYWLYMCGLCFRPAGMQYYTYVYAYFNCPPVVKENEQKKARLECHLCSQFCGKGGRARARADLYFYIP